MEEEGGGNTSKGGQSIDGGWRWCSSKPNRLVRQWALRKILRIVMDWRWLYSAREQESGNAGAMVLSTSR